MKRKLQFLIAIIVFIQFFSCSTDYDGQTAVNQDPILNIYDTSDITSSKKTKIQWYANDNDGIKTKYYYTVTTDTTLTESNVKTALNVGSLDSDGKPFWTQTENTYAYVALPYRAYHSEVAFMDTTTYEVDTLAVPTKAVFSKFFVFGVDENGKETLMQSKLFKRTNKKPKFPMVFSKKLDLKGYDQYWMTVGADSSQMVLEKETSFWKRFDFKWMGEDPDGQDVELEFRWELLERRRGDNGDDTYIKKVAESITILDNGDTIRWSVNNLSAYFDKVIKDNNDQGQYAFKVWVRDDAFEESENHATINFEVFAPELNKGILLINDTDPDLYPPPDALTMGNPDGTITNAFYESLLEYSGFEKYAIGGDSLNSYTIKTFSKGTEFVGWEYIWTDDDDNPGTPNVITDSTEVYRGVYDPGLREISKYKLVIIASDDRDDKDAVDFRAEPPYTGYHRLLASYLDVGGNVFLMGNSVVLGKFYSNGIPINGYAPPFKTIYYEDGDEASVSFDDLMSKYFGIYSITFPEQKTYYTVPGTSQTQYCTDSYNANNYDFVGTTVYDHISSTENILPLKIDNQKVNDYWFNVGPTVSQQNRIRAHALKENGTVFTGVPILQSFKGEVVYKYESIFDLDELDYNDDDYSYDLDGTDTLKHYLWNKKYTTESFEISALTSSFFAWTQEPVNYKWVIKTTPSYSGAKCLKSSDTLHVGDWMQASIDVELNGAGSVSFAYKTLTADSLVEGSGLNFLIDDVSVIGSDSLLWRGDKNWRKVTYNLPAGAHKLSWRYEKSETALETDAVWIDYIDVVDEHFSEVMKRSGSVATRFIADNGDVYNPKVLFKTAFFGLPAFFLDDDPKGDGSVKPVSDMFKAMIDWFDINGGKK